MGRPSAAVLSGLKGRQHVRSDDVVPRGDRTSCLSLLVCWKLLSCRKHPRSHKALIGAVQPLLRANAAESRDENYILRCAVARRMWPSEAASEKKECRRGIWSCAFHTSPVIQYRAPQPPRCNVMPYA